MAGFGIFGRHVGASWSGPYGAPRVSRYNVYTSEATLYDFNKNEVVWTGTIRTTEPDNIDRAIKDYVQAVIKALNERISSESKRRAELDGNVGIRNTAEKKQ